MRILYSFSFIKISDYVNEVLTLYSLNQKINLSCNTLKEKSTDIICSGDIIFKSV